MFVPLTWVYFGVNGVKTRQENKTISSKDGLDRCMLCKRDNPSLFTSCFEEGYGYTFFVCKYGHFDCDNSAGNKSLESLESYITIMPLSNDSNGCYFEIYYKHNTYGNTLRIDSNGKPENSSKEWILRKTTSLHQYVISPRNTSSKY